MYRTLDETRRLGAEALQFHVEGMLEDGEELPSAAGLEAVMRDPENAAAVAFLVPIEIPTRAAVRVNVTFAAKVLEAIDAEATKVGTSRSALLAEASLDRIRGPRFTVIRWEERRMGRSSRRPRRASTSNPPRRVASTSLSQRSGRASDSYNAPTTESAAPSHARRSAS